MPRASERSRRAVALEQIFWQEELAIKARLLVALQFGLLFALFLEQRSAKRELGDWRFWLTILLFGVAVIILGLATFSLRPSLRISPIPRKDSPLITTGIYAVMRHPMYVAVSIIGAGLCVDRLTLLSTSTWVALVVILWFKARYEDSLLREIHSDAGDYQSRVKANPFNL
jgi:protein-S-isoprenylcysteine O-methyltransferase Ste14